MKLVELKEEFTKITGMPAKKMFLELATGKPVVGRLTKAEWIEGLKSVLPQYRVGAIDALSEEIRNLETQISDMTNETKELKADIAELKKENIDLKAAVKEQHIDSVEDACYLLNSEEEQELLISFLMSTTENKKHMYRQLSKKFHPDTKPNNEKPKATLLMQLLNRIYNHTKDTQNDRFSGNIEYASYTEDDTDDYVGF